MSEKKHELIIAALGLALVGTIIICAAFDMPGLSDEKYIEPDVITVTVNNNRFNADETEYENTTEETVKQESTDPERTPYINLNTASAEDLTALNNIGPEKANAIIEYREQYGGFNTVEELTNIYGIGENTVEEIRDYITLE